MQKIPSLFEREQEEGGKRFLAVPRVNEECRWVLEGEGVPTEKWDGTACLVRKNVLYRRLHLKQFRGTVPGFLHWSFDPDVTHGHGWVPVQDVPADRWHLEAWGSPEVGEHLEDGTYELVGPAINKNPYDLGGHELWRHGSEVLDMQPFRRLSPEGPRHDALNLARHYLEEWSIEGIVWHHPDGRMAKLKRRDFGLQWPVKK